LSTFELETKSGGQIATDASKLDTRLIFLPFLIIGPLEAISILIFLFNTVDISFLSGLVIYLFES
jgi:hypothetical protein